MVVRKILIHRWLTLYFYQREYRYKLYLHSILSSLFPFLFCVWTSSHGSLFPKQTASLYDSVFPCSLPNTIYSLVPILNVTLFRKLFLITSVSIRSYLFNHYSNRCFSGALNLFYLVLLSFIPWRKIFEVRGWALLIFAYTEWLREYHVSSVDSINIMNLVKSLFEALEGFPMTYHLRLSESGLNYPTNFISHHWHSKD